mmetsp:Transcript_30544/g.94919  ORF Transcript_30544/g.94919 Transcript_30544/m.94919 type:complete len:283 (+) Transcript_30544:109-957(+)
MVARSCMAVLAAALVRAVASVQAEGGASAEGACEKDVTPFLEKLFSSLGHNCDAWFSLFAEDAFYSHQHDGHKNYTELLKTCQGYAKFCPGDACFFKQNGAPVTVPHEKKGETCAVLVPYLWTEMPANGKAKNNLEPHTGWEYMLLEPSTDSKVSYIMKHFAEIETSYSLPFNWAKPADTPALVEESLLKLLSLPNSASKGECARPLAPKLTEFFAQKSKEGKTVRQQGSATVLAAGGICQVAAPYAADIDGELKTGRWVIVLKPEGDSYTVEDDVEFRGST